MEKNRSVVTSLVLTFAILLLIIGLAALGVWFVFTSTGATGNSGWLTRFVNSLNAQDRSVSQGGTTLPTGYGSNYSNPGGDQMKAGLRPPTDFDQLADRLTVKHDVYVKMRDQALAAYAKNHPTPQPYDDRVRAVLCGIAYHQTWGDPMGEGTWYLCWGDAYAARQQGSDDPMVSYMINFNWYDRTLFDYRTRCPALVDSVKRIDDAGYPAAMRVEAARSALYLIFAYRKEWKLRADDPVTSGAQAGLLDHWQQAYRDLINANYPHELLYRCGDDLQDCARAQQPDLDLVEAEEMNAFNGTTQAPGVQVALQGTYLTTSAWNARGSGWADSVTSDGWRVFGERLAQARIVLEGGYRLYPGEEPISCQMMTVVLGQQTGRDELEQWFQHAIAADPHSRAAYKAKEWFLQPRWSGSVDDLLSFGQECVKTQDWANKIPLILPQGMEEADQTSPGLFARERTSGPPWRRPTAISSPAIPAATIIAPSSPPMPTMADAATWPASSSRFWATAGTGGFSPRSSTPR